MIRGCRLASCSSPIDGRVLEPGTALTVKGVKPRSTVYVGPRLLVSRGPRDEDTITALEREAERAAVGGSTVSEARTEVTR